MSRLAPVALQARPSPAGPLLACTAAALLLVACDGGGGGPSVPLAAAAGSDDAFADPLDGPFGDAFDDPAQASLPGTGDAPDVSTGAPGEVADCGAGLPCRWTDADRGFAVTLVRADNTAREGRLELHARIETVHDTELAVTLARTAVDRTGARAAAVRVALDGAAGTASLPAGGRLPARIDFDAALRGGVLPEWGMVLSDNGTARAAAFANVPVGPQRDEAVDCAGSLPCTWTSADGLASVEVVGAGGFASQRRLHVDLRISSTAALSLIAGPETVATSPGGTTFRARSHAVGGVTGQPGDALPVAPGMFLDARIDFLRGQGAPATLDTLVLDLYRDAPVPRWRPGFANVPALAP